MARGLTAKDLEHIDELAAFYVESKENAKLLDVMSALYGGTRAPSLVPLEVAQALV